VVPARLVGYRTQTKGHWEGLYLDSTPDGLWRIIGKTRGRLSAGETLTLVNSAGQEDITLLLGASLSEGGWVVRPESKEDTLTILDRVGRVPLPPYIRKGEMVDSDRQNYQTVFAKNPGAVAAPTAGLHFTEPLLRKLEEKGIHTASVTLHVGLGTFRPVSSPTLAEHPMHAEWASIDAEAIAKIDHARRSGGRVVAVGTTSMRVLETAASEGTLRPFSGMTKLFIRPPFAFHAADALLTNFHLPRSTLLVLVRTFGGDALIRQAYEEAIREEYRFYSYGDAMLIL
jgi:S-adenosylmethionine:tRNA ribosyltransferase-isomerase